MMKKIVCVTLIMIFLLGFPTYATNLKNDGNTNIPSMSMEDFTLMMQARQVKVDIIKKNNKEITSLKEELKNSILVAVDKVNELKIEVYKDSTEISDETIIQLKELLEILQEAKSTLETDADKIFNEIENILDLITTKSMQLDQYDLIIEKQNIVIVKMKEIMKSINKI